MKQLSFEELDPKFGQQQDKHQHGDSWIQGIAQLLDIHLSAGWPDRFGEEIRNTLEKMNHTPIRTLSLFSGGGGLDIAFHDVGFHCINMVEVENKYVATLQKNTETGKRLSGAGVECVDIRHYEPSPDTNVDFIIGGPPCQTFSAAGRRASGVLGTNDPRGTLFEEYVRILRKLRPKGFLFENVYGIVSANKGRDWKAIVAAFEQAGYHIFYRILDSADYGVPQHRERLIIVGLSQGEFYFPYPTHGPDSIHNEPYYTAGAAVDGIKTAGESIGINGKYGHLLDDIPPGLNYSFYTEKMGHPNPVFGWRSKFSDFLYKADPDGPVRTIKAQGGQYTGPFSWENRPFTLEELKRLQTFPDDYEIIGNRQVAIEQIGNSVPPQMGRILGLSILDQVFNVKLPFKMNYMPADFELGFRNRKRSLTSQYRKKAKKAIDAIKTTDNNNVNYVAVEKRSLTANFKWGDFNDDTEASHFNIKYDLQNSLWTISATTQENSFDKIHYEVFLTPNEDTGWILPLERVILQAFDFEKHTFTALWKAFEEKMYDYLGVADLVQLCGYYQYTPRISARMHFADKSKKEIWRLIQLIVHGVGVSEQMTTSDFARSFDLHSEYVLSMCEELRTMGYEVRNHNTNPQIPTDNYLIPYLFPTLTHRSVQLHKRLG